VLDLVGLQGDQRRDDDRRPAEHDASELVDRRLPAAGGHDGQHVTAVEQVADDGLLIGPQRFEPELCRACGGLGRLPRPFRRIFGTAMPHHWRHPTARGAVRKGPDATRA
jgi:hypothetical protein